MTCKKGPLLKLTLWLKCALEAWPAASMIGKADDDVWAHLSGVALSLRQTMAQLRQEKSSGEPQLVRVPRGPAKRISASRTHVSYVDPAGRRGAQVWGALEAFHWHRQYHRPMAFNSRRVAKHHCRLRFATRVVPRELTYGTLYNSNATRKRELGLIEATSLANTTLLGPFGFAKGPLYFASAGLVRQVVRSTGLAQETEAILDSAHGTKQEVSREPSERAPAIVFQRAVDLTLHTPCDLA